jgi:hypothetical protein
MTGLMYRSNSSQLRSSITPPVPIGTSSGHAHTLKCIGGCIIVWAFAGLYQLGGIFFVLEAINQLIPPIA